MFHAQPNLPVGALCLGRFSADDCWYRARVEAVDSGDPVAPRFSLFFIDFGNREAVPADRVRPIDAQLAAVPPQAQLCALAYLKVGREQRSTLQYSDWCRVLSIIVTLWSPTRYIFRNGDSMLQVPGLESEIGLEACRFLSSAAVNKRLVAIVEVLVLC